MSDSDAPSSSAVIVFHEKGLMTDKKDRLQKAVSKTMTAEEDGASESDMSSISLRASEEEYPSGTEIWPFSRVNSAISGAVSINITMSDSDAPSSSAVIVFHEKGLMTDKKDRLQKAVSTLSEHKEALHIKTVTSYFGEK